MREPEGFEDYVTARRDTLVRFSTVLTGDRDTAEDLVQNALMRVWSRWNRISRSEDVDAYVRTVLLNQFRSSWRHRRWREVIGASAELPEHPTDDESGGVDLRLELLDRVRALPAGQRAVIALRFFLDLPEAEVAHALGVSLGTVKSQTHRAVARLGIDLTAADEQTHN